MFTTPPSSPGWIKGYVLVLEQGRYSLFRLVLRISPPWDLPAFSPSSSLTVIVHSRHPCAMMDPRSKVLSVLGWLAKTGCSNNWMSQSVEDEKGVERTQDFTGAGMVLQG